MEKKVEFGRGCVEGKAIGERQEEFRADEGFSRPRCRGGPAPMGDNVHCFVRPVIDTPSCN